MVLVEHMPLNLFDWLSPFYAFTLRHWRGAGGVDLFFAISGFVITSSLAPRLLRAAPGARKRLVIAFWLRRIWRLAPAAWLWVAIPILLSAVFNRSDAFHSTADDAGPAAAALLNVANIYTGLFWPRHIAGITSPYWSLSLEEQFYLLFPLALLLLRQRLVWLMVALVLYQFFLPTSVLANMTRPGAIAAGVVLGLMADRPLYAAAAPQFLSRLVGPRLVFLPGAVVLGGALLGTGLGLNYGLAWGLEAVLWAALVFAASFDHGYVIRDGIGRRTLLWVGARSYSLYLVHMPVFALAREIAFRLGLPVYGRDFLAVAILLALALPMLILVAEATYRWVERPLRNYGKLVALRYAA